MTEKRYGMVIDTQHCVGCQTCTVSCKISNEVPGSAHWNHLESLDGVEPSCVAACPANARVFGDLNDPESAPSKLMQERHAEPYLPEAGTHPSVYYI